MAFPEHESMRPEDGISRWEHLLCVLALLPFALAAWLEARRLR